MPDLFLLFNHAMTRLQETGARQELNVDRIVSPPAAVQGLWSNVPPELESLAPYLRPVLQWLGGEARPGDYVLVQGDFGACCLVSRHTQSLGCIPIYSTTFRQAEEQHLPDGRVQLTHTFSHVRFRRYEF
ncbi:MAG TPA: hypothetical protein ENN06_11920 [Desulfobacteraceae bacterium]|nr:hypothetical protein [Desulfobacteraceae bacterium]